VSEPVEFLELDDVLDLARVLLGDPPPLRDVGLLGSAVARPQTTVGGQDAYPTVWSKAAALLQSIVDDHALIDGNERLGWLATAVFLEINDASVAAAANDDVYDLVMAVAASSPDTEEIARRLERMHSAAAEPSTPAGDGGDARHWWSENDPLTLGCG
jgi:death-on-curing protein